MTAAETATEATIPAAHVHRWTGVDFLLDAGHPIVRQSCVCGASRSFRAFERFWNPHADAGGSDPLVLAGEVVRAPDDAADGT